MAQAEADRYEIQPKRHRRASLRDGRRTPPTAGGPEPIQFLFAKRPPVALRPWGRHDGRSRDLLALRIEGGLRRREIEPDPDASGGQGRPVALAELVGRTPWSTRDAVPLFARRIKPAPRHGEQADEGVGRGPGGPPHHERTCPTSEATSGWAECEKCPLAP